MARSRKHAMTETQLVAQAVIFRHPAHGGSRRRRGRPTNSESASALALSQFDPSLIRESLDGYGVRELVQTLVKIARCDDVDEKGRAVVAPMARLKATERIRQLHVALAETEPGVLERQPPDPDEDPGNGYGDDPGLAFLDT